MGITLHYEGRLKNAGAFHRVFEAVRAIAKEHGWRYDIVDNPAGELTRFVEEEETTYRGRVRGLVIYPHAFCEPFSVLFGDDLVLQDFCKTQFAGAEIHVALIAVLRRISTEFEWFDVIDEGEYWESEDQSQLKLLIEGCEDAIREILVGDPNAKSRILLPDGRIVDVLR